MHIYLARQVLSFGHLFLLLGFVLGCGALLQKGLGLSGLDIRQKCVYLLGQVCARHFDLMNDLNKL